MNRDQEIRAEGLNAALRWYQFRMELIKWSGASKAFNTSAVDVLDSAEFFTEYIKSGATRRGSDAPLDQ